MGAREDDHLFDNRLWVCGTVDDQRSRSVLPEPQVWLTLGDINVSVLILIALETLVSKRTIRPFGTFMEARWPSLSQPISGASSWFRPSFYIYGLARVSLLLEEDNSVRSHRVLIIRRELERDKWAYTSAAALSGSRVHFVDLIGEVCAPSIEDRIRRHIHKRIFVSQLFCDVVALLLK